MFRRQSKASTDLTMIAESPGDLLMMESEHEDDGDIYEKESSTGDVGSTGGTSDQTGSSIEIAVSEAKAVKRSKRLVYGVLSVFALSMVVGWSLVRVLRGCFLVVVFSSDDAVGVEGPCSMLFIVSLGQGSPHCCWLLL